MNIGEEICGEWLRHVKGCDFIQYNIRTLAEQGEIDVVGIDLRRRIVYGCEVAVHLITGLQYVRKRQPDNVPRLTAKFRKDLAYLRTSFPDYKHVLMLWSPVVRNQREGSKHNQLRDVRRISELLYEESGVEIQPMVNQSFQNALAALRSAARRETKELDSSVMRYLQVEEHLKKHLARLRE